MVYYKKYGKLYWFFFPGGVREGGGVGVKGPIFDHQLCVCACMRACMRVCMRACMRACMLVC